MGTALFPLIEHGLNGLHRRFFIQPENLFLRPARAAVPFLSKKGTKDDSGSALNTPLFYPFGGCGAGGMPLGAALYRWL